ncbi:MAG TPA: hypothetical protein VFX98_15840 [Longimicrobiaceae bacterium]|nr:hypothetical protein [Longimicrobiaceae bacterium]
MSRMLELPDPVYTALHDAASACGLTPAAWIAAHLPSAGTAEEDAGAGAPQTLADRFAGRVGRFGSGGRERLSEDTGDRFAEHLEAKRRAGSL